MHESRVCSLLLITPAELQLGVGSRRVETTGSRQLDGHVQVSTRGLPTLQHLQKPLHLPKKPQTSALLTLLECMSPGALRLESQSRASSSGALGVVASKRQLSLHARVRPNGKSSESSSCYRSVASEEDSQDLASLRIAAPRAL